MTSMATLQDIIELDRRTELYSDAQAGGSAPPTIFNASLPGTSTLNPSFLFVNRVRFEINPLADVSRSWVFAHGSEFVADTASGKTKFWRRNICYFRKKEKLYNISGGNGAVTRHLKKHAKYPPKDQQKEAPAIQLSKPQPTVLELQSLASLAQVDKDSIELQFQQALATWFTVNHIAFRQVQNEEFKAVFKLIGMSKYLPSREDLRQTIIDRFTTFQLHLKTFLKAALSIVNLSFDLWTSPAQKALLGVVAHFIDEKGVSRTILLALRELVGPHTGELSSHNSSIRLRLRRGEHRRPSSQDH